MVVWVDSFSDGFAGGGVEAVVEVLTAAGYAPRFLERPACCGLTWISTGQLDGARRQLRSALDVLHPVVAAGTPVVGLEPSCTAVWRGDAAELLPGDERVAAVRSGVLTLAELLSRTDGWSPPDLSGSRSSLSRTATTPPSWAGHRRRAAERQRCAGHDRRRLLRAGRHFGVEQGHYEVSVKIAEHDLLPAAAAHPDAVVLADGFSCRTSWPSWPGGGGHAGRAFSAVRRPLAGQQTVAAARQLALEPLVLDQVCLEPEPSRSSSAEDERLRASTRAMIRRAPIGPNARSTKARTASVA